MGPYFIMISKETTELPSETKVHPVIMQHYKVPQPLKKGRGNM